MLTVCRTLSWIFVSQTSRRFCTSWSLDPGTRLFSSPSAISSIPPFLSHPGQSQSTSGPRCSCLFSGSCSRRLSHSAHCSDLMDLKEVLQVMEQLAPLSLAESWDNVGLLVEPTKSRPIKTILLTNDLTAAVMEEARAISCDLIVSYHPPLFRPFKRLVQSDWKQRLAVQAIESGIAIFSPHTSWDSVKGGVNDWLVGGLGKRSFSMENAWKIHKAAGQSVVTRETDRVTNAKNLPSFLSPDYFECSISGVCLWLSGSGKVSVLSPALSSLPSCHKLEFTVKSTEEFNTIMEELKACNSGAGPQYSSCRLCFYTNPHTIKVQIRHFGSYSMVFKVRKGLVQT